MEINKINGESFNNQVLESTKPVLVDFSATWCLPCKMLAPVLEEINSDENKNFDIVKVDIDDDIDLAKKYGVMSVPTMILFKDGKEVQRLVGLRQKKQILEAFKNN